MKLGVTVTPLDQAQLVARAAESAARWAAQNAPRANSKSEVSNGERELGAAAGDPRQPDER